MWDLVAQDSYSCRHASLSWRGEGRPDNQAICKVMKAVSHDYHHSQQRNPLSWEHKASVVLLKLLHRPWQLLWARQLITKSTSHSSVLCCSCWRGLLWCEQLLAATCSGDISVHSKSSTGPCRIEIIISSTEFGICLSCDSNLKSYNQVLELNEVKWRELDETNSAKQNLFR